MKYKIAFLTNDKLEMGGVETHFKILARLLDPHKFQVIVIAPMSKIFEKELSALGAQPILWKQTSSLNLLSILRIIKIIKTHRISLLHIHSPSMTIQGRIASLATSIPSIITTHLSPKDYYVISGTILEKAKYAIYMLLGIILNKTATDKLIYVSRKAQKKDWQRGYISKSKSTFIPNGVQVPLFQSNAKIDTDVIIIGFWGRIEQQKGLDVLIQSVNLIKKNKKFQFWLIGSGSRKMEIQNGINKFCLNNYIEIMGLKENIFCLTRKIDIFVLPSRYEAMSISLLEAMASGLPCIVTDIGENASLVKDGIHGFVVPPENPQALATAIEKLINSPALRKKMGKAARIKVGRYTDIAMAKKTEAAYLSVLKERSLSRL